MQSKDKDMLDDCISLIKKNIDIHYNFPKKEMMNDPYIQLWFVKVAGHGVGNEFEYSDSDDDILPKRPLSSADFGPDGEEDPFGIYLLEDKEACVEIAKHNCVLIGEVGKELNVLKQLLDIDDGDEVFAKNIKWRQFCPKLPLTDIVICDNYYFKDFDVYRYNNNELIKVLSSVAKDFPINVVIITRNSDISNRINIYDELENIREFVQEESNNRNSSVTIIGTKNGQHDRELITNYYRISSSAGFQMQRYVKSDIRFHIRSHTRGRNYHNSWELIKETYQKALKQSVFCIGDKVSNLIYF